MVGRAGRAYLGVPLTTEFLAEFRERTRSQAGDRRFCYEM
jgi:hypothetical protein